MQKISPIKQRILQYIEVLGVSKRYFYETIGVSRGTLESSTGITEDIVAKFIANYPEINPEWLLTGKGEMLLSGAPKEKKKDCIILPLVPIEAMAGYNGHDFPGVRIEDCVLYEVPDFVALGAQFVIRVSGSSMTPAPHAENRPILNRYNTNNYINSS